MNATFLKQVIGLLFLMVGALGVSAQVQTFSLHGRWSVKLDPDSVGEQQGFYSRAFTNHISLPGTLDEAGYGTPTTGSDYGILTRKHKYVGPAWYTREIVVPKTWKNQSVRLFLERVMWESKVWIDGRLVGKQEGLGTPHSHDLGNLKPGKHQLTVRVNNDMIYNIGDKGHSYGEYTQIIWNGMIGRMELQAVPKVALEQVKVWPDAAQNSLSVTYGLTGASKAGTGMLTYVLRESATGQEVLRKQVRVPLTVGGQQRQERLVLQKPVQLWDDLHPNLYTLEVAVAQGGERDVKRVSFGFRSVTTSRSKILINQRPVFMRGNLDCVHFPKTGYPSCDVAEWERIFRIYKAYGLNHVRFHSWCPPEAAFVAADRLGIYIQAEVLWIDWWMSVINPERPEMTTRGLPKGLGHNPSADTFVPAEMKRMVEAYGNHPSFVMMCIGNELGNSDFEVMQEWVKGVKASDNRRLYSVSTARKIMPVDQYMVTHNIPGIGGTYGFMGRGTDSDRESIYSQASIPIIAHELGQFPVYPLWSEIDKYTGVLEARNLKGLKQLAEKNGVVHQDRVFHEASGALQSILYKELIENLVRTPSCAGFEMLSMTDYSGQGEALVGWLDSFWESKGIIRPETFRGYANEVVPLARFSKYVWSTEEDFQATLQVAHYGEADLRQPICWSLSTEGGRLIEQGTLSCPLAQGQLHTVGRINIDLSRISSPTKCVLQVTIGGTEYHNSWSVWVYPPLKQKTTAVCVKTVFDDEVVSVLNRGGKVLLLADQLGKDDEVYPLYFTPLFWSNSFFPGQSNKTLGAWIDRAHPALAHFPTDSHTNWQWQEVSKGRAFVLNAYPQIVPIVQPISDFHLNDRLASVFECRVGKGKLLVCGHRLAGLSLVGEQLKRSLLDYMEESSFDPTAEMQVADLQQLFAYTPKATVAVPKGFENAVLYVACGKRLTQEGALPWSAEVDKVEMQDKRCSYLVKADNVWKDDQGTAWTGKEITVEMKTPNGIIGSLYAKFEDWNGQNRAGVVSLEGRESVLTNCRGKAQWVKLFVMREDTNDGKVIFKARATEGGNLMISELALIKD